jgi:ParB family chromosome partitioning protein
MLELALVENIQREDLNPIEKAEAFRDYLGRYQLTQEQAGERIGVDRATLANHLRLLELPGEIQQLVRRRALGMSHARTIASLPDEAVQMDLANKVIRQGWSVRQLERTVQRLQHGVRPRRAPGRRQSPEAAGLERELGELLGTKVRIEESAKAGSGRIVVDYYTLDDFDRILSVIRR